MSAINWVAANPVATAAIISSIALLASAIVAAGVAWFGHVTARKNALLAARAQAVTKRAEMRQAWINNLRDAMAKFQSYASTPEMAHRSERELYELGTKIELFMNPKDDLYEPLVDCLYQYLSAETLTEKWSPNSRYVDICQQILRTEWLVLKAELAHLDVR